MILYYLLVSAMPLTRHPIWSMFMGELTMIKYLGLACVLYAAFYLLQRRDRLAFFETSQARWFWVLVGIATLSYVTQGSRAPLEISPIMIYVSFSVFFFITRVVVDSVERLRNVVFAAIVSMAVASLYVLREWQKSGFGPSRPGWVTGDPNYFTVSVLVCLPLAYYFILIARSRFEQVFGGACLTLTLAAVIAGASRGGFLGLVGTAFYLGIRARRRIGAPLVACGVLLVAALVVPSTPLTRFLEPQHGDVEAQESRLRLWSLGWQAFLDHPLTGVGAGNFRLITAGHEIFNVAHNTYIEVAAELGVPGFLAFLAVLGTTFWSAERVRRRAATHGTPLLGSIAAGMQAGLVGYGISAFFVSVPWQKALWLLVFLSISLQELAENDTGAERTNAAAQEVSLAALDAGTVRPTREPTAPW